MIITQEQKKMIERLAEDGHSDALIAYGADMYRQGIIKGLAMAGIGLVGFGTTYAICKIRKHFAEKKESES